MKVELTVATSAAYDTTVQPLVDDAVASKLASQDPTLWGPDAESEASARLSWVGLPVSSRPLLAEIDALRAQLWSEGHCCVARSGLARDWCHELVLGLRVRWFPVPSRGDLGGGAVVPAVRPVLP